MASILNLSDQQLAAAPVIVTSPTTRCGTTLIQRLLCASDNGFIYGEEIGSQFRTLAGLFAAQIRACDANGDAMDDVFALALAGGLRDWRPGLTPPSQVVLNAWTQAFYPLPTTLAAFGQTVGRPIWGFKWPGCPADTVRTFMTLMPRTRVVYVLRNVVDALKSAKARLFVLDAAGAAAFCADWASSVKAFTAMAEDPRVLVLKYEDLIEDRQAGIAAIAAFTGVSGIRQSEFDLKVNTFEGDEASGHSPTGYIEPQPLTDQDWAALHAHAGEVMARHYPNLRLAA
jgi:hypothetical protein